MDEQKPASPSVPVKRQTVLGFVQSEDKFFLMLVRRVNPPSLYGKFTGIYGDVDTNEKPADAMARTAKEKHGLTIEPHAWRLQAVLSGAKEDTYVYHGYAYPQAASRPAGAEESHVTLDLLTTDIRRECVIDSHKWIIPLALDGNFSEAPIIKLP